MTKKKEQSAEDAAPFWRDKDRLRAEVAKHVTLDATSVAHGVSSRTLQIWWQRHGLPKFPPGPRIGPQSPIRPSEEDNPDGWFLDGLKSLGDSASIEALADHCDRSPRRVREAADRLGKLGFRVEVGGTEIKLEHVPPARHNLHPSLFDGDILRVGVVSDTHLGSNEEALEELHFAYDIFDLEGITQVWHAGDWGTGIEIFKTQHSEAKVHTLDEQVTYLIDNYPSVKGITTRGISGNHDITGSAGKAGFDPLVALASKRDDIEYLGLYDAWIETRPETNRWIHLLHGAGGMSYSWSYKAQRLVDSYPSGRKPSVLIVGHWHVRGNIRARDVEVLWPGCFEWQSPFMKRLGLQPSVGFHIIEMTIGDDGSIVRWATEWFPFYLGRKVAVAEKIVSPTAKRDSLGRFSAKA